MSLDSAIARARRAYLGIEPDPRLAGRIATRFADRRKTPALSWWIPAGVAATALLAVVLVLERQPIHDRAPAQERLALGLPSMPGTLRTPKGMRLKSPSLHRTRALPVLPPTPTREKPKPRTDTKDSTATSV